MGGGAPGSIVRQGLRCMKRTGGALRDELNLNLAVTETAGESVSTLSGGLNDGREL